MVNSLVNIVSHLKCVGCTTFRARPEYTVWVGAIAPSYGKRGSVSLSGGLGTMPPLGSRGKPPEAESDLKTK